MFQDKFTHKYSQLMFQFNLFELINKQNSCVTIDKKLRKSTGNSSNLEVCAIGNGDPMH